MDLNIVEKEYPVTDKSKKTIYEKNIKSHLSDYRGFVFEKICVDYLYQEHVLLRLPFIPEKIGKWWGNNPIRKKGS